MLSSLDSDGDGRISMQDIVTALRRADELAKARKAAERRMNTSGWGKFGAAMRLTGKWSP